MKKDWVVDVVARLPQGVVSRGWGWLARQRAPRPGIALAKRVFVRATGVDLDEAAEPIEAYDCLESLFVRRLKAGARPIDRDPHSVVSPVDARVGACGTVEQGTLLQAKGRAYSLARLLDDEAMAARFEGGSYMTLYLSPRDYHRIHAPVAGAVAEAVLVPGSLMPVFDEAVAKVDELFARNERLTTYVDHADAGRVAVVKVGATLVGRITAAYDPDLATNQVGQLRRRISYSPARHLEKGGELGAFELGSTVVLVTEPRRVVLDTLAPGSSVRVGQRIGTITPG